MWTRPSTPSRISTNAPKVTTLVTLPSSSSPTEYIETTRCHGSSWVCLRPREMRWRSRSMSRTLTSTFSPIETTSLGWLTCDHESSEMWMRPSMPLRSTNAPNSTMFEMTPSTTRPGWRRSRISWRCSLRSSSSTARRERTTLLRERLSSMTLHSIVVRHELVEVRDAADVDERRGQEAAHAEVDDQAALDDLDDGALDGLAGLGGRLDAAPCLLEARTLLGHDEPAVLVLLGEDQRIDLFAERDLVVAGRRSCGSRARCRG